MIRCAGGWCFWIMGSKSERIMPKWPSELGDFGFSGSEWEHRNQMCWGLEEVFQNCGISYKVCLGLGAFGLWVPKAKTKYQNGPRNRGYLDCGLQRPKRNTKMCSGLDGFDFRMRKMRIQSPNPKPKLKSQIRSSQGSKSSNQILKPNPQTKVLDQSHPNLKYIFGFLLTLSKVAINSRQHFGLVLNYILWH